MQGKVIETTGSWYKVQTEGSIVLARLKGKLRLGKEKLTNPVAVGDNVILENSDEETSIVIASIEKRRNQITRISPRKKYHKQIIAANIDQAIIVASMRMPQTKKGFISRLLVALEYYEIEAIVLFNKMDLIRPKEEKILDELKADLDKIGYAYMESSAKQGTGIEALLERTKNKTNVFTGSSGVGKSSLINALLPELDIKTKDVSEYNEKGLHTTTAATMYGLPEGGYVVDTPGIKEYGVTGIDPYELSFYFPEMREHRENCKFNNCQHLNEPKCGVLQAFVEGKIPEWRYNSYELIRSELMEETKTYV